MANGAGRIFQVMKATGSQEAESQFVSLKVRTLDPLTFMLGDKLIITPEFCVADINFDPSILQVEDTVNAIVLNQNQLYYLLCNVNLKDKLAELENRLDN
jgi:hypothetical protein